MELLIVRHAIAHERDRRRWSDDGDRPLTPAGKRLARRAAAGLENVCIAPDRVWSSPLVRARQTAHILAICAGWPAAEETEMLLPDASAPALLRLLAAARDERIGLVGHQPALGTFLACCLTGRRGSLSIDLKKPAVASIRFDGKPRAGTATLAWLATPRMLRAMR